MPRDLGYIYIILIKYFSEKTVYKISVYGIASGNTHVVQYSKHNSLETGDIIRLNKVVTKSIKQVKCTKHLYYFRMIWYKNHLDFCGKVCYNKVNQLKEIKNMSKNCCMCGEEIESGWKSGFEYLCESEECINEWFVMEFSRYEADEEDYYDDGEDYE